MQLDASIARPVKWLALCAFAAWGCARAPGWQPFASSARPATSVLLDSLTVADRALIIEAAMGFREAVFLQTAPFDACAVNAVLGDRIRFEDVINRYSQKLITGTSPDCLANRRSRGHFVLPRKIVNYGDSVSLDTDYAGGSIAYSERYTVVKNPSRSRPTYWRATDLHVYGIMFID